MEKSNTKLNLDDVVSDFSKRVEEIIKGKQRIIDAMPDFVEVFNQSMPQWHHFYAEGSHVIIEYPTQESFKPLRVMVKTMWEKTVESASKCSYRCEYKGIPVTVNVGELPPTCKIVEEEVEVPAVPAKEAYKTKVIKVQCGDAEPQEIGMAAPEIAF